MSSTALQCLKPVLAYMNADGTSSFRETSETIGSHYRRCGVCAACLGHRVMQWSTRVRHEGMLHDHVSVLTLTYDDDHLPQDGSLVRSHLTQFIEKVRYRYRGQIVRFFGCGEYGEKSLRPHYHLILFGPEIVDKVPARKGKSGQVLYSSQLLDECWDNRGFVVCEEFHVQAAAYIAAYIMKKKDFDSDENGFYEAVDPDGVISRRVAPFVTSSQRPAIGDSFFFKYRDSIYGPSGIVLDGKPCPPVKRYDELMRLHFPDEWENILYDRMVIAGRVDLAEKLRAAHVYQHGRESGLNTGHLRGSRDGV